MLAEFKNEDIEYVTKLAPNGQVEALGDSWDEEQSKAFDKFTESAFAQNSVDSFHQMSSYIGAKNALLSALFTGFMVGRFLENRLSSSLELERMFGIPSSRQET